MRRILVAQNIGLWIRLNRELSGVSEVDLVETPSVETARLLAQLERPAIVVFSGEGGEDGRREAESLVADLERRGSTETRVVLSSDDLEATPRPLSAEGGILVSCALDDLGNVVTELLALTELPKETIDLLVRYHDEGGDGSREGFVVVLALDEKNLLLQCDQPFEVGTELSLSFFLPSSGPGSSRKNVSLRCELESCRDEADLIYAARVSSIDAAATAAVQRFLAGSDA